MKFQILTIAIAATPALALAAPQPAPAFNTLSVHGQMRVELTPGDRVSVDVSGSEAAKIETRSEKGVLIVRQRKMNWRGGRDLDAVVHVRAPTPARIRATRGADVRAPSLRAGNLEISASTGAIVRASGACRSLHATASMGAVLKAGELRCGSVDARTTMGGEAEVRPTSRLVAKAGMGGVVDVRGRPANHDIDTSLGGEVNLPSR